MLSLLPIFLLLIIPVLMLLLHLSRWRRASQWFLVVIGLLLVLVLQLVTRTNLPQILSNISWEPKSLFPLSPVLLIDDISWSFSIALIALTLAMILTAVARVEQVEPATGQELTSSLSGVSTRITTSNWTTWAGSLLITGMGLVAVQAGNLLTILLAWAAIDLIELLVLLVQANASLGRERATISFSTRAAGIGVLILAQIQIWQTGRISNLSSISPQSALYLLLAAGLRLGVIPLHLPFLQEIPLRRSLGTILRLVPAAASLSLLVRAASVGIAYPTVMVLLVLCAFAALLGAGLWALASDELAGRPYWILGTASMATASAVLGQTGASLAWGVASILAGGLLFLTSLRHPWLRILAVLGFLGLSGFPYTPNWQGVQFYTVTGQDMPGLISSIFYIVFIFSHALLLTGFLRHSMRPTILSGDNPRNPQAERWIWFVYPLGLIVLPVIQFLIGIWSLATPTEFSTTAYLTGLAASGLGFGFWYISQFTRTPRVADPFHAIDQRSSQILSFSWLYRPLWYFYNLLQRMSRLVYALLEGDGGILWAIVLLFFILMYLQR